MSPSLGLRGLGFRTAQGLECRHHTLPKIDHLSVYLGRDQECQSLGEECERAKGELADAVRMRDAELASVRREAANDRRRLAIAEAGLSERDAEVRVFRSDCPLSLYICC